MQLIPWSYQTKWGFILRGHHSIPSGKPVLHLLHGNGFCSMMYWPMLQILQHEFDFFLSDVQGHGDSDHGGQFVGWNESASLAQEAWQAHQPLFGTVEVYGVGHSFGGVLTALLHSQPLSPFNSVVLLDPVLFTPAMLTMMKTLNSVKLYHKNPLAKAALRRRQQWQNKEAAIAYLTNRGMFRNWHPSAVAAYVDFAMAETEHGLILKCQPQREADIFSSFPDQLWQQLYQPCTPTYVLYGENSYPFIEKSLLKWQAKNPAVTTAKVAGGHCFMQENPEFAATEVKRAIVLNKTKSTGLQVY